MHLVGGTGERCRIRREMAESGAEGTLRLLVDAHRELDAAVFAAYGAGNQICQTPIFLRSCRS